MRNCSYAVADLLPHTPPMVLLDEVLGWEQGQISTTLTIRPGIPFFMDDTGVPSYVGLEYMAQACGAYAGLEGLSFGRPVRLGFLLGTRSYHASVDWFVPGERLIININEIFRQELMGVFDCRITCNDIEVASAQLNLYQPEDAVSLLEGPLRE
jgi:predicted hotdog family 3-hydroxylacyl-ACP dehydratase